MAVGSGMLFEAGCWVFIWLSNAGDRAISEPAMLSISASGCWSTVGVLARGRGCGSDCEEVGVGAADVDGVDN